MKLLKNKKVTFVALLAILAVLSTQSVSAMHIMEGYLPLFWCIFWFAVFLPFFVVGLMRIKKIVAEDPNSKTMLALSGAFIFILSSLKIPSVTGSSSHPTGVGLGTAMFGPSVISVLGTICLLFQALLLAHGGFSMAVVGPFVGYFVYKFAKSLKLSTPVSIFICAVIADLATYATTSIQLGLVFPDANSGFVGSALKFMGVFLTTQIPIAIVEGLLTVVLYNLISENIKERAGLFK